MVDDIISVDHISFNTLKGFNDLNRNNDNSQPLFTRWSVSMATREALTVDFSGFQCFSQFSEKWLCVSGSKLPAVTQ